ncbi:MAG: response regulator [Candidatus Omnitrophota bacterium]
MGQQRSILIVDDDVDASQMVKMILEKTGLYAVSICNRGSEALTIVQSSRPELVLLDIMMPDADGTDIADQIQKDQSLVLTKIVFMTSLVSQNEVTHQSVIGGHPFIAKPISGEALLQRVKGLFALAH